MRGMHTSLLWACKVLSTPTYISQCTITYLHYVLSLRFIYLWHISLMCFLTLYLQLRNDYTYTTIQDYCTYNQKAIFLYLTLVLTINI